MRQAEQVRSWPLPAAGFYALTLADSRHDLVAANISRLESDLDARKGPTSLSSGRPRTDNQRRPGARCEQRGTVAATREESIHNLWWYAMCLLLVAVVTESLVASRYLNTLRDSS